MATFPFELRTERLELRRLSLDDESDVFAYASHPEVAHYMTFPRANSVDDVRPFLSEAQKLMDAGSEFTWALRQKGSQRLMGAITLRRTHGLEFGYVLHREFWGNGYMTEAARTLLDWGFMVEGAKRIWATCDVENTRSASVLKKLGMTEEGILRAWVIHPNMNNAARDCRVFSITQSG